MLNSSGEVVISDGTAVLGVAKWSKVSLGLAIVVDEEIEFAVAGETVTLAHPNVSNLQVRSAAGFAGAAYAAGGADYTLNATNGTITHVAAGGGGTIPLATTVYVSYGWSLTEADYAFEGKNFWNSNDYVSIQDYRIAVIQPPAMLYTAEYDTDQVYALSGANSNLYVNASGQFTTVAGGSKLVGHVVQIPSAKDPFLGMEFHGTLVANT